MDSSHPGMKQPEDSAHSNFEIIEVPNKLRAKIRGSGPIDPKLIEKAETAIKAHAGEFRITAMEELSTLADLVTAAQASDAPVDELEAIFGIVHDLKGQGTTFGYSLLTKVADSLCRFIEKADTRKPECLMVVAPHVDALRVILRDDVHGDDHPLGVAIVESLIELRRKAA